MSIVTIKLLCDGLEISLEEFFSGPEFAPGWNRKCNKKRDAERRLFLLFASYTFRPALHTARRAPCWRR